MTSHFRLQKPYELASLPKSLDQTGESYAVGEVFGHSHGVSSKKRKRSELTVGVDGEALNLYDISSSRLITSYPVPPQATFTCPPHSLRWRSETKNVTRYTYASTLEPKPKLSLYKDSLGTSGTTASTSVSHRLPRSHRIVYLTTISATRTDAPPVASGSLGVDLVGVDQSGTISCFDGESLDRKCQASPEILKQDTRLAALGDLRIDFAQTASSSDVARGLFGGKDDFLKSFSLSTDEGGDCADVIVLVSSSSIDGKEVRHVHLVAVTPATQRQGAIAQGVVQAFVAPLPASSSSASGPSKYRLDIASGTLLELCNEVVTIYDISAAVPRVESELHIAGVMSFLRLSKSSLLTATIGELSIYNPLYRSLQASISLDASSKPKSAYTFVAYFARLEMAVAVCGTSLVAVQLEAPKTRTKKRRAEGLLIDCIGRGLSAPATKQGQLPLQFEASTFSTFIPSSLEISYGPGSWAEDARKVETLMESGDFAKFERFMARSFQVKCTSAPAHAGALAGDDDTLINGGASKGFGLIKEATENGDKPTALEPRRAVRNDGRSCWAVNGSELPVWRFPEHLEHAERRLLMYAIHKAFTTTNAGVSNLLGWQLRCRLPWSGVLQYLTLSGQLSVSNLKSALESDHSDMDGAEDALAEQLPLVLAEADPTLDLLLTWLSTTRLGPVELLSSVKIIMRSLELIQDPKRMTKNLLLYPHTTSGDAGGGGNGEIGMELDLVEEELHLMEHLLSDESSNRGQGLSIAFSKLGRCPSIANVRAIRQVFKPEEALSLIYLLRMELNRDGWTSRYLDGAQLAEVDNDEDAVDSPPDSSIRLIADLLCQCIDAVGPGGWLINDILSLAAGPRDHLDSADFLNSMKLEVSAALEGVEEAVYLRGVLTEMVKYGVSLASQKGNHPKAVLPQPQQAATKDTAGGVVVSTMSAMSATPTAVGEIKMLPLGSRAARQTVTKKKIVSGAEIKERTMREIGHLTSKKVADYSFERIVI